MTIDRPNLANAFKGKASPPVDRSSGLAGLLPPTRRTPAATPAPTAPPAEDTRTEPTQAPAATRKPRQAARTQSAETHDVNNVAVYLEPDLLVLVKDARRVRNLSYDELTVEAFAHIDDSVLKAHFNQGAPAVQTGNMPTRQRRPRGISGIQIQLRLDGAQRSWLDQKREDVGAPSRSALVAAVLRLQLG